MYFEWLPQVPPGCASTTVTFISNDHLPSRSPTPTPYSILPPNSTPSSLTASTTPPPHNPSRHPNTPDHKNYSRHTHELHQPPHSRHTAYKASSPGCWHRRTWPRSRRCSGRLGRRKRRRRCSSRSLAVRRWCRRWCRRWWRSPGGDWGAA